jgi:hypothetical protein
VQRRSFPSVTPCSIIADNKERKGMNEISDPLGKLPSSRSFFARSLEHSLQPTPTFFTPFQPSSRSFFARSLVPFTLTDLHTSKQYAKLTYMLIVFNWFTAFAFYPFLLLVVKLFGILLILYQAISLFGALTLFLALVYQSLIIRLFFAVVFNDATNYRNNTAYGINEQHSQ